MTCRCVALGALIVLVGCGAKPDATKPETPVRPGSQTSANGEVHLLAGSPQLQRIKVAIVQATRVALDEVIAPGKIESNPNRISKVLMPVAGRVTRVMAAVGDAVTEGQPLLSIQSPDASMAVSAFQQTLARLGETKATLTKAEADLSRVKDLYPKSGS